MKLVKLQMKCAKKSAKNLLETVQNSVLAVGVQVLSEGRIRLVSGLKRYFHSKRGRGLISGEGVQLLDHACSAAADDPKQRLNIWQNIEK